jgi:hypothetical protein
MLHPEVFRLLEESLNFRVQMDCFATRFNSQVLDFISHLPDHKSFGTDFFSLAPYLKGMRLWANPPFKVILRVLEAVRLNGLTMMIVVPFWPRQVWWAILPAMLAAIPLVLPIRPDLYLQRAATTIGRQAHLQQHPEWISMALLLNGALSSCKYSRSQATVGRPQRWFTRFCSGTKTQQLQSLAKLGPNTLLTPQYSVQLLKVWAWTLRGVH